MTPLARVCQPSNGDIQFQLNADELNWKNLFSSRACLCVEGKKPRPNHCRLIEMMAFAKYFNIYFHYNFVAFQVEFGVIFDPR